MNELTLRAIQIQPTVAYKINDKLSVGGGVDITVGSVKLIKSILQVGRNEDGSYSEGKATLDGSATLSYGYNLGVFYKPSAQIEVGLSYRSKVVMKLEDGSAEFEVPASLATFFPEGNTFNAELPLPSVTSVGISYHVSDQLVLGTQFDWVGWSAYESLAFDFKENSDLLEDTNSPRNYEDSWVWHLGGEYLLNEQVQLRAGFYYDTTPVQEGYMTAETPDNNRMGFTAGLGYSFGEHIQLDLSFLYVHSAQREQTTEQAIAAGTYQPAEGARDVMPGTYKLNALIPGFSIAYKF